jgi:hypothetical protein
MRAGWGSLGSDLDPLALMLARVKTRLVDREEASSFVQLATQVAERSEARVRERVPVHADLPAEERAWYDVHVLKEMAGLLQEIGAIADVKHREALQMVFSSLVIKFSRQRAETAERRTEKRVRKGLVSEFFARKAMELVERWSALASVVPYGTKRARFVAADVAKLPETIGGPLRVPLVLGSPPYAGTYDYATHHRRRHAWLGLSAKALRQREIGARRHFSGDDDEAGPRRWDEQVSAMLAALARLVEPDGVIVLCVGDGEIGGRRIAADRQLERLAPAADLALAAVASQSRPDFRTGAPRSEHLVLLRPIS